MCTKLIEFTRPPRLSRRLSLGALRRRGRPGACRLQVAARTTTATPRPRPSHRDHGRPIAHFERGRPDVKRFGDLEFRGGLVLTSPSTHFGGWSDLIVEADGSRLLPSPTSAAG
jgi:hypothetical protein